MLIASFILSLLIWGLAGCGTPGAPLPPSLGIPKPVNDLKAVRKGERVTLTWSAPDETTDGELIRHEGEMVLSRRLSPATQTQAGVSPFIVARLPLPPALKDQPGAAPVAEDSLAAILQSGSDFALYSLESRTRSGKSAGPSSQVPVALVPTPPAPSQLHVTVTQKGVILTWEQPWPAQNPTRLTAEYLYRISRREQGSNVAKVVQQAKATNEAIAFVDDTIEWQKHYDYWVTPVTRWRDGAAKGEVEGDDSPVVPIYAEDIFPPAIPEGLQAVFSGSAQQLFIDLAWTPNTDPDLAGYNVYRYVGDEAPVKINSALVNTPSFRDTNVSRGKKYFYAVSAVDLRGNESGRSKEASETVPQEQ